MLGIRAVWVVSLFPEKSRNVLFFRKFMTVEQKIKVEQGTNYVALPPEEEFLRSLIYTLGLSTDAEDFIEDSESPIYGFCLPVIAVKIREKVLWPILLIEQNSYLFCCLPGVRKASKHILYQSVVSLGFATLIGMARLFGSVTSSDKLFDMVRKLDHYLTGNMPFGTPFNADMQSLQALSDRNKKRNSWKSLSNKPSSVMMETSEFIKSSQFCILGYKHDQPNEQAVIDVSGNVTAKLDSLHTVNEISLSFEQPGSPKVPNFDSVLIHPCVQTFTRSGDGILKRMWFPPVLNDGTLCMYTAKYPNTEPPISGLYKMKGVSSVELNIHLKLNENIKNSFSFFEVVIPFFNRGPIQSFEFKASQGHLYKSEDRHSLKWNIGIKFTSKTLDAYLKAKIDLANSPFPECNDQFCCGKNGYIQINFRQLDETPSHFALDPKSITTTPACKAKFMKGFLRCSNEYRIWNTFGELPFPAAVEEKWPKEHFSVE